jgi:hypothetical protein
MEGKRILFVGLGELGSQIFDLFVRIPGKHTFLVGGRNERYLHERTNLSILAATQLGFNSDVSCRYLDLQNIEQTAQTIEHFQPDIIFCAATLQRWGIISALPKPFSEKLYTAQMGPWLPMHLTLMYKLMQAVKQTGQAIKVINASFPDIANVVLSKAGLAPITGVGDIANNIPALRKSIALKLSKPLERVEIRFFAQRFLSYRMSRLGNSGGAPFHLVALVDGNDVTRLLDMETIFDLLPTKFKRIGGTAGQLMTAASATVVFDGLVNNAKMMTHVPGPNGLPGGYPVIVNEEGVEIVLPEGLTLEQAIRINEDSMKFDGVERIDNDGTVYFTEQNMAILKETFGYECKRMPLSEVEDRARELYAKYQEFAGKHR